MVQQHSNDMLEILKVLVPLFAGVFLFYLGQRSQRLHIDRQHELQGERDVAIARRNKELEMLNVLHEDYLKYSESAMRLLGEFTQWKTALVAAEMRNSDPDEVSHSAAIRAALAEYGTNRLLLYRVASLATLLELNEFGAALNVTVEVMGETRRFSRDTHAQSDCEGVMTRFIDADNRATLLVKAAYEKRWNSGRAMAT